MSLAGLLSSRVRSLRRTAPAGGRLAATASRPPHGGARKPAICRAEGRHAGDTRVARCAFASQSRNRRGLPGKGHPERSADRRRRKNREPPGLGRAAESPTTTSPTPTSPCSPGSSPAGCGRPSTSSTGCCSSRPGSSRPRCTPTRRASRSRCSPLAHLFGFELMPRIRNWKDLNFYRPAAAARYRHIDGLFGGWPHARQVSAPAPAARPRAGGHSLQGSRHHPAQKQRLGSRPGNGDRPEARVGSSGAVFPECKVAARAGYLALSAAGARWRVRYTVARETVNSSARSAIV